jgi:hypothetical protein
MESRGTVRSICGAALLTLTAAAPGALAQTDQAQAPPTQTALAQAAPPPEVSTVPAAPVPAAPAVPPPPYSLPWQLRPAAVGNAIRLDTSVGFYSNPATAMAPEVTGGSTIAYMGLFTYKVTPTLAPIVRMGVVQNDNPGPMTSGTALANPIVGMTGGWKLPFDLRASAILAGTIPVGTGGTKTPAQNTEAAAIVKGIPVRSAMDNAMFAVNYFTALGGFDIAWVKHGLTVQLEATLLQLLRVRNEICADGMTKCTPDSNRTNLTAGLHLGYFIIPMLSLGTELRYQQWLKNPSATGTARENFTFAVGPRFHFKLSPTSWLRPGISYSTYIDQPLSKSKYSIIQVDVPFAF